MTININKINDKIMWSDIIGVTKNHTSSISIKEIYFYSYDNIENMLKIKITYKNDEEELFELNVSNEENTIMILKYKLDLEIIINVINNNIKGDQYLAAFITKLINDGYNNYSDLSIEMINSINILYDTDITQCEGMTLSEMQNIFYQL